MSADRRRFLQTSLASAASLSALTAAGAANKPGDKVVLAVMGVRGRGRGILSGFSNFPDVEIAYVCEVDDNVVPAALKGLSSKHRRTPKVVRDFRRALDDKEVNA